MRCGWGQPVREVAHGYTDQRSCEGADENSWQSRPRYTRASNKVLRSASMAVHLTAADLARVMLLLDASTIAKNVGRHLVFAASRHDVCSHSDLAATPMAMRPGSGWVESADDALVVLIKLRWPDASPRCQPADCLSVGARGGVVWARPHDQDQLCRVRTRSSVGVWVGRSRVGVSCTQQQRKSLWGVLYSVST
jgi:hypothetical protein